jgi:hypothetical protein
MSAGLQGSSDKQQQLLLHHGIDMSLRQYSLPLQPGARSADACIGRGQHCGMALSAAVMWNLRCHSHWCVVALGSLLVEPPVMLCMS